MSTASAVRGKPRLLKQRLDEHGVAQRASLELLAQPEALRVGRQRAVEPELRREVAVELRQDTHTAPAHV